MKTLTVFGSLVFAMMYAVPVLAADTSPSTQGTTAGTAMAHKASTAVAPELGKITPNGPYRIWTAINAVLPDYAMLKGGAALRAKVEGLTAVPVSGKKPGEVLRQGMQFKGVLEALRERQKLNNIDIYTDPLGRDVTPGVVYVNAGFGLDGIVECYHLALNDPDATHGKYYGVPAASGKTPSDVYALVELATRRLRLIEGS
jgi:hypothetical protein